MRIETRNRGNTQPKPNRMDDSPEILSAVRNFVMTKRVDREVCTAWEVLRFCIENQLIHLKCDVTGYIVQKEYKAAIHSVQRCLKRMVFYRGSKIGSVMVYEAHITKVSNYVRHLSANISLPLEHRKQEVFIDESYIHHH